MKKINIYDEEKNLWVGSGIVSEEGIVDCAANLGDPDSDDPNGIGIYEAIEEQIARDMDEGFVENYSWKIREEDES